MAPQENRSAYPQGFEPVPARMCDVNVVTNKQNPRFVTVSWSSKEQEHCGIMLEANKDRDPSSGRVYYGLTIVGISRGSIAEQWNNENVDRALAVGDQVRNLAHIAVAQATHRAVGQFTDVERFNIDI